MKRQWGNSYEWMEPRMWQGEVENRLTHERTVVFLSEVNTTAARNRLHRFVKRGGKYKVSRVPVRSDGPAYRPVEPGSKVIVLGADHDFPPPPA